MKTAVVRPPVSICVLALSALMLATNACQRAPETKANLNVNSASASNVNVVSNSNVSTEPISVIAAREPDKYRATLVFTAQTQGGEKAIGIPTLSAEVARSGADRRVSFKLPDGSDLIYLDHAGTQYVIAPGRKQYAELTPEATGFQLGKLMTPGQLVSYLEKLKGVEAVGEEPVNGRTALKYRYAMTSKTGTSAGDVNTESFVYVDKETGLPLRTELFSEASGNVQGVKAAKIVAEMRDISTDVSPTLFEVPVGLNKVPAEQVKAQIDAVTGTVTAVLRTLLANMNSGSTSAPAPSPATTASPAASPRPTN
jgi:outer membrane lipoprotein-sorting protein